MKHFRCPLYCDTDLFIEFEGDHVSFVVTPLQGFTYCHISLRFRDVMKIVFLAGWRVRNVTADNMPMLSRFYAADQHLTFWWTEDPVKVVFTEKGKQMSFELSTAVLRSLAHLAYDEWFRGRSSLEDEPVLDSAFSSVPI